MPSVPKVIAEHREPCSTRQKVTLSWMKVTNTCGNCDMRRKAQSGIFGLKIQMCVDVSFCTPALGSSCGCVSGFLPRLVSWLKLRGWRCGFCTAHQAPGCMEQPDARPCVLPHFCRVSCPLSPMLPCTCISNGTLSPEKGNCGVTVSGEPLLA